MTRWQPRSFYEAVAYDCRDIGGDVHRVAKLSEGNLVDAVLDGSRAIRLDFAMQRAHPKTPHHYLQMIGTRPERQGTGAGTMLIATLLKSCDEAEIGAYLESSNPENLPFYARHGFVPRPSFPLPKGCPPCTPMWRDPEATLS